MSRQCPSEPPARSAPNLWTTHASFIGRDGSSCGLARLRRRGRFDVSPKSSVLQGELLDTGKEHAIEMILAPEVLLAVLEQPSGQRQQHFLLGEQDESSGEPGTVRSEGQVRLEPRVDIAVDELREQRGVEI